MRKILLLLAISAYCAGCANGTPRIKAIDSPLCGAVSGFTVSYFAYGEGKMVIVPLSEVLPETVFVIGLRPLDGFGDAVVTVSSDDASWINASGKHDELPKGVYPQGALEVGCVPATAANPGENEFKFKIDVEKGDVLNTLDPRVRVNW